jgi:hypothetical protein
MTATIEAAALGDEPDTASVGVLERNRAVLARVARVIRAATNLDWVAAEDDPAVLRARLAADARMLACGCDDVEVVLGWLAGSLTQARLAVWSDDPVRLLALAERDDRVISLLGWPSFLSMPRSWELALATRTLHAPSAESTSLADVFAGVPAVAEFRPGTRRDRERVVLDIGHLVERTGAADRTSARIGEVAHELVINATYVAPVDAAGDPRYAGDRNAEVTLAPREVPVMRFATDGILVALQMTDPFGRLTRGDVLTGIRRGMGAGRAAAADVVDRNNGGAGLGLWRIYSSST